MSLIRDPLGSKVKRELKGLRGRIPPLKGLDLTALQRLPMGVRNLSKITLFDGARFESSRVVTIERSRRYCLPFLESGSF